MKKIVLSENDIRKMVEESVKLINEEFDLETILLKFLQNKFPKELFIKYFCRYAPYNDGLGIWVESGDYINFALNDDLIDEKTANDFDCSRLQDRIKLSPIFAEFEWKSELPFYDFVNEVEWNDKLKKKILKMDGNKIIKFFEKWLINYFQTNEFSWED